MIALYSTLGRSFMRIILHVARSFAAYALKFADKDPANKERVMEAIRLIKSYICEYLHRAHKMNRAEGSRYARIDKTTYHAQPLVTVRCALKTGGEGNVAVPICANLTVFHLKNAISAAVKVPRARIRLYRKKGKLLLTERFDQELVKEHYKETEEAQYAVEIQEAEFARELMPSYAIANFPRAKDSFLRYMRLDEGTYGHELG